MDQKRAGKESTRAASKRQKTAAVGDDEKEHSTTSKTAHKQAQPAPTSNTTRRPFFGVIDNVSSFSGVIEGPYDFGFAISITVDRQTFKGVVYKSNPDHNPESAFPDEEVMINFAAAVNQSGSSGSRNNTANKTIKTNASQEEVRLPDITTFHFQDSRHGAHEAPRTPHDSPRTPHAPHTPHTPHDIPRTPLDSPSPKDDHTSDTDEHHTSHAPSTPSHPPHVTGYTHQMSPSSSFTHPSHHPDDQLPAIHSVLQGINNLPPTSTFSPPSTQSHHPSSGPSTTTSPPPLPPQPQLQRQKQRQKKRQEKKLMELQQQQPARYQSLLDREKSKIPLLGDESLVHAGLEILQHIGEQRH